MGFLVPPSTQIKTAMRYSPPSSTINGHACFDMQEHRIRLGRFEAARMINRHSFAQALLYYFLSYGKVKSP